MQILDPEGKPVQSRRDAPCPKCGAGPSKRVPSGGFGEPHLVCSQCAYEFEDLKCEPIVS